MLNRWLLLHRGTACQWDEKERLQDRCCLHLEHHGALQGQQLHHHVDTLALHQLLHCLAFDGGLGLQSSVAENSASEPVNNGWSSFSSCLNGLSSIQIRTQQNVSVGSARRCDAGRYAQSTVCYETNYAYAMSLTEINSVVDHLFAAARRHSLWVSRNSGMQ